MITLFLKYKEMGDFVVCNIIRLYDTLGIVDISFKQCYAIRVAQ